MERKSRPDLPTLEHELNQALIRVGHFRKQITSVEAEDVIKYLESRDNLNSKSPDGALFVPNRAYPTITLEVGYSETYDDLKSDAKLLLEGSSGKIGSVILVKIEPLKPGEQTIKSAFIQVYGYDTDNKKMVRRRGRKIPFPRPLSHASQTLTFSWQEILMDQVHLIRPTTTNPPALQLDELRDLIEANTIRHLQIKQMKENQQ